MLAKAVIMGLIHDKCMMLQGRRSCVASSFRSEPRLGPSPSSAQQAITVLAEWHNQSCVTWDTSAPAELATKPNAQKASNALLVLLSRRSASRAVPGIIVEGDVVTL
jgi:hypothetical protein